MQAVKEINFTDEYIFQGNEDLPVVKLSKSKNIFEISGKSLPEDVTEFYQPIIDWFSMYALNPNEKTVVDFKLEYLNSGSSKMIFSILQKLQEIHFDGKEVLARWHYQSEDEDLRDEGKGYLEKLDMPFELIDYSD